MKLLYYLPLLLLFSCNKPDIEPVSSIAGTWRFDEVLNHQYVDISGQFDSTRLVLGVKEAKLYKAYVVNGNLVDSLIGDGIYETYWGMVPEYLYPAYPDSVTEVQYQMIDFTWADAPPYPYHSALIHLRITMNGPDHLYTINDYNYRYFFRP